jgi:DNA mismatch repair protein MutS
LLSQIRKSLQNVKDTERCLLRLHYQSTGLNDFLNIVSSLDVINQVSALLASKVSMNEYKNLLTLMMENLGSFLPLIELSNILTNDAFERALVGGFIRIGVSERLDNLRKEREQLLLDKNDLKIKLEGTLLTNEFSLGVDIKYGPVLEFPRLKASTKKDIHDRIGGCTDIVLLGNQRSTTTMRYSSKEWFDLYLKIQKLEEDIYKKESFLLQEACDKIKERTFDIIAAAKTLAELDVSAALAVLAKEENYTRPQLTNDCVYQIQGGRHPVVEFFQKERNTMYVKNDANICGSERLWLLTGANMGGKSTFLRQRYFLCISQKCCYCYPGSNRLLCASGQGSYRW